METVKTVLEYWFGEIREDEKYVESRSRVWFGEDETLDTEIRTRFTPTIESLILRQASDWEDSATGRLAAIIVLDQFSRNAFRGTPRAFTQDPLALRLTLKGLEGNIDRLLHPIQRLFFYLPLEHSEDLKIQEKSIQLFTQLVKDGPHPLKPSFQENLDYAVRHYDIIRRFGRFPHRNKILGRESSAEEVEFLKEPRSSF